MLLFFRRTTALGALVLIAVLTNIVILNFCYDVPVKLYSSNLLLMSIFLIAPDLPRLANVLLLNRPVPAARPRWQPPSTWIKYGLVGAKLLFLGFVLFSYTKGSLATRKTRAEERTPKAPLFGYYEVEDFIKNHHAVPFLTTEPKRWKRVGVSNRGDFSIRLMDASLERYTMEHDAAKKTLMLSKDDRKYLLTCDQPDPTHLVLDGVLNNDSITVRLRKLESSNSLLLNRGFHWINEAPFNR